MQLVFVYGLEFRCCNLVKVYVASLAIYSSTLSIYWWFNRIFNQLRENELFKSYQHFWNSQCLLFLLNAIIITFIPLLLHSIKERCKKSLRLKVFEQKSRFKYWYPTKFTKHVLLSINSYLHLFSRCRYVLKGFYLNRLDLR